MLHARRWTPVALLLTAAAGAQPSAPRAAVAPAQPPEWVVRANALANDGEVKAAMTLLDSLVHARPRDGSAWHLRGQIYSRVVGVYHNEVTTPARIRLIRAADSSFRLATLVAPDSGRFHLSLLNWLRSFGPTSLNQLNVPTFARRAVAASRNGDDGPMLAEALDELAHVYWQAYQRWAQVRQSPADIPSDEAMAFDQTHIRRLLDQALVPVGRPMGEDERELATEMFHEALAADPTNTRAARRLFVALVDHGSWSELRRMAVVRRSAVPRDHMAWLAEGYASWQLGDARAATAAFDTALARMDSGERDRYVDIGRLLARTADAYAALSPVHRAERERIHWANADPLALTPENEHRLEFLSRMAHADLTWTSEDGRIRGAETDAGQLWVRYGPPTTAAFVRPPPNSPTPPRLIWQYRYDDVELGFVFTRRSGTVALAPGFRVRAEDVRITQPVLWDNVAITRTMDTVRTQVARFRADGDSSDVLVVASVPVGRMTRTLDLARVAVDVGLQLSTTDARVVLRDVARETMALSDTSSAHRKVWQVRLPPAALTFRAEALQRDAERAARGTGRLTVERRTGFGMSDLLVGERIAARSGAEPARWSDLLLVPAVADLPAGEPFGVAWETYALGDSAGASRYRVDVRLSAVTDARTPGRVAAIVARVVGGVAAAVGVSGTGTDAVSLSFTRQRPRVAAAVDFVTLDLGETRPGRYLLSVQTTDLTTGRSASSDREIRIVP